MWPWGPGEGRFGHGEEFGSTSVNDDFMRWGDNVPAPGSYSMSLVRPPLFLSPPLAWVSTA